MEFAIEHGAHIHTMIVALESGMLACKMAAAPFTEDDLPFLYEQLEHFNQITEDK